MQRTGRWIVGSMVAVFVVGLLIISPVLTFGASNGVAALSILLLDSQPTQQELIGTYIYKSTWGVTTLQLKPGSQFEEHMNVQNGITKEVKGTWGYQSAEMGHAAGLNFRPFLDLQDETHGNQYDYGELIFYKPRFGQTYGEINGDTGARFTTK